MAARKLFSRANLECTSIQIWLRQTEGGTPPPTGARGGFYTGEHKWSKCVVGERFRGGFIGEAKLAVCDCLLSSVSVSDWSALTLAEGVVGPYSSQAIRVTPGERPLVQIP